MKPIKRLVKKNNYKADIPVVKKIGFKEGILELREENVTGMDLYLAQKDELIVSKINFHQGAVAINGYDKLVCSTHYQPYQINHQLINQEYFVMVLRSQSFLNALNAIKSNGIKNEFTPTQIGELEIPLPPLAIQQQLVSAYQDRLQQAAAAEAKANELENGIETYLLAELDIEIQQAKIQKKGLQFVKFSETFRWDFDYLQNQHILYEIVKNCKYNVIPFGSVIRYAQYGISQKASIKPIGLPLLRMNNIFHGELNVSNLKYVKIPEKEIPKLILQKNDFLFNRTNSKELVGKTAVFDVEGDYLFASYLIRLKLDEEKVNVHFVNLLFNSPIIRTQIDMISRRILGQANVNLTELKNFLIPLPPLSVQTAIVLHINEQKAEIKRLRTEAEQLRTAAKTAFEQDVFE